MNFPILSIDTKKKEMTGNFFPPGQCYSQAMRRVNDHDFVSFADGLIIPHGIYDVKDLTDDTTTSTGLLVHSYINAKNYQIKRTVNDNHPI